MLAEGEVAHGGGPGWQVGKTETAPMKGVIDTS